MLAKIDTPEELFDILARLWKELGGILWGDQIDMIKSCLPVESMKTCPDRRLDSVIPRGFQYLEPSWDNPTAGVLDGDANWRLEGFVAHVADSNFPLVVENFGKWHNDRTIVQIARCIQHRLQDMADVNW